MRHGAYRQVVSAISTPAFSRISRRWPRVWSVLTAPAWPAAWRLDSSTGHRLDLRWQPAGVRSALPTIATIEQDGLMAQADCIGALIRELFAAALAGVKGVRGHGLMIGIELDRPCGELVGRALASGY